MQPEKMEEINNHLQNKYKEIEKNEIRYEMIDCEDADIILVAFGLVARICSKAAKIAREKGLKVGVFRPISLYPFPYSEIKILSESTKGMLVVEMNAGQMVEDVRLAVNGKVPVEFHGRMGGIIPTPEEILHKIENIFVGETA